MLTELGHFALILAALTAALQAGAGLWGARARDGAVMRAAGGAAAAQAALVALAFAALIAAYLRSDFSVLNVYENSHSAKPLLYKLSGAWGNHEGSMLMWILMLAALGAAVALFGRGLPATLRARVVGIQGLIGLCFLAFSLATSNPFARLSPVPPDGTDLNPLLQDPGLAFHPPFLYLGYVGMSVAFSFALAALLEGEVTPAWARWVRPWTLAAWASLTLGIAMGSWWAYYELGWGGYWFWDPVENASLMPWLAGTALLHSAIVVEKRDTLKAWCVLMAILAFATSLLGTFVVRSGVLTSVHSFATDPQRGVWLLVIFAGLTGGALALFAARAHALRGSGVFSSVSRESALVVNNVLLCVLTFTVLLGTFWPLGVEVTTGERMTVGPPYYTLVTTPLMALLAVALSAGVLLPWKRGALSKLRGRLGATVMGASAAGLAVLYASGFKGVLAAVGFVIGVWIVLATLTDAADRIGLRKGPRAAWRRARGLPGAFWGGGLAHLGMGVAVLGMVGTSLWVGEEQAAMRPGDTLAVGGYDLRFDGVREAFVANYAAEIASFTLLDGGRAVATLQPERRWYPVAQQQTVEAAIVPRWASDVYVAIGEPREGGARVVRAYHHPLVLYLWGGALMMVAGGVVSLTDRRYRVGAPQPRPARAPALVPAE